MAIYGSNGSGWQQVASGDLKASNGSSWATVKRAYRSTGSSWDEVYVGSDSVTYYFVASASKAGRGTSWKTSSNQGGADYPQISRYITAYPWYGLVKFTNDTSGVSLSSRMSVRPVVKSAYFNVQRWNDGGFGSGYGNLYVGRYTGSYTALNPDPGYCDFTYYAGKNWSGSGSSAGTVDYSDNFLYRGEFVGGDPGSFPYGVAEGGIELGSNRQNLVDHVKDGNALCLSHTTNNGSSTGGLDHYGPATYAEQANYWNFLPAGSTAFGLNVGPTLIVTLDYV